MINEKIVGVIPIYKEQGLTSHDVVARVRRLLREKRIGHTGTLDPQVTGVLPLCIGQATRIVEYLQDLPKEYEVELVLGFSTNTEDLSGEVIDSVDSVHLDEEQLKKIIASFIGHIQQVPPMYSAVRVNGKRLYELARAGQTIVRNPRQVIIYEIDIQQMELNEHHPRVHLRVLCSKGTYIRTLCADIGAKLGVPAVMGRLIRTQADSFSLDRCVTLEDLETAIHEERVSELVVRIEDALHHMPKMTVDREMAIRALHGQKLKYPDQSVPPADDDLYRLYEDHTERFLGVFRFDHDQSIVSPVKVFQENDVSR